MASAAATGTINGLKITRHARCRMQQRGVPKVAVDILLEFGKEIHTNGVYRITFDKRGRKRAKSYCRSQAIPEKVLNIFLIVKDNRILTVGHRTRRYYSRPKHTKRRIS